MKFLCLIFTVLTMQLFAADSSIKDFNQTNQKAIQETITEQKIHVLLELAEAGVVEANYRLAEFAKSGLLDHLTSSKRQMGDYLSLAAAQGHTGSLRSLAYSLLISNVMSNGIKLSQNEIVSNQTEGLVLMSESAFLGNKKSLMDLLLLPKMLTITEKDIENSFVTALKRLSEGKIIECEMLSNFCAMFPEKQSVSYVNQIKALYLLSEYRSFNITNISKIFQQELSGFSGFSQNKFNRSVQRIQSINAKKQSRYKRENSDERAKRNAQGMDKIDLDRVTLRNKVASKILREQIYQPSAKILKELKSLLDVINRHRTKDTKLTLKQFGISSERKSSAVSPGRGDSLQKAQGNLPI
ncbi:MAG: hypothetical protein ABGX51_07390 [Gammaproteobacteria bacterium]